MLIEKHTSANGVTIAIWHVTENVTELLSLLKHQEKYFPEFEQLKKEKRQAEWICARLLIQDVCGEDKIVCYNEHGKPFLHDNSFRISISHTKNYVAVIVHPTQDVGIDIEQTGDKVCRLKERFLNAEELQAIDQTNETIHLLLHWGAKEVMFKMMNRQNVDFSEHLHIYAFVPDKEGTFWGKEVYTEQQESFTFAYRLYADFTLVWSVKN